MELIDRAAVYEDMMYEMCGTGYQSNALSVINRQPAIEVETIQHGKWKLDGDMHCHCSNCNFGRNIRTQIGWKYCPLCGTKMDLEEKDNATE